MSNTVFTHSFHRVDGDEFVKVDLRLTLHQKGLAVLPRMSITGCSGFICSEEAAQEQAMDCWISYFEEVGEGETLAFLREHGINVNVSDDDIEETAAKHVVNTDGEYHGLDVDYDLSDGDRVFVTTACGQIVDEIKAAFPELRRFMSCHLNDMRPSKDGKAWLFETLPEELEEFMTNRQAKLEDLAEEVAA